MISAVNQDAAAPEGTTDHTVVVPASSGGTAAPPVGGTETPPAADGTETRPAADGTTTPPGDILVRGDADVAMFPAEGEDAEFMSVDAIAEAEIVPDLESHLGEVVAASIAAEDAATPTSSGPLGTHKEGRNLWKDARQITRLGYVRYLPPPVPTAQNAIKATCCQELSMPSKVFSYSANVFTVSLTVAGLIQ